MLVITVLYVVAGVWLAIYGLNALVLAGLYLHHRRDPLRSAGESDAVPLPVVTVQLPIYNERHVVERLIDAATALDWPRDRFRRMMSAW